MVMVFAGQRRAHRPQRMQRVSSFNIAVPVMLPNSAGCMSSSSKLNNSGWFAKRINGVRLELNPVQRNQLQAILRTNIHAAAAEHAVGAVLLAAFENGVDVALQAALRLRHGFLLGVAKFDLGHAGAAIERQHGNGLALDVHVVHCHLPAVEHLHFNLRLWMLGPAKVFVNANRRALAVANAVNDEARSECAIAAGEYSVEPRSSKCRDAH